MFGNVRGRSTRVFIVRFRVLAGLTSVNWLSCQLYGLINITSVIMEAKYEKLEFSR